MLPWMNMGSAPSIARASFASTMPSVTETKLLGAWGESVAADYLRKHGYVILGTNYRCRLGEIDLIASKKGTVCFVEVKTRRSGDFAQAMEYVDKFKQDKLRKTAALWLSQNDAEENLRFDVVEVYAPEGTLTRRPKVRHWEDAFQ